MGRSATPLARSFGFLVGMWMVVSACLMVGLATVAIERVAANEFKIANVDLVELAGPVETPTNVTDQATPAASAAADLSRRLGSPIRYGATGWTVVNSRLVSRASDVTDRPIVITEVVVTNTHGTVATRVRAADVSLILPDGQIEPVDRFEFIDDKRVFSLDPGESLLVLLVFKPDLDKDPDLDDLTLAIGESGRLPVLLPIVGESAAEPVFPRSGTISAEDAIKLGDGVPGGPTTTVRPDVVAIDLNAGHYRAAVGQQVIVVEAAVNDEADESADRPYLDPSYWRLAVGGVEVAPIQVSPVENGRLSLSFVVDAGPAETVLTAAANTLRPSEFEISFVPGRTG